MGIFDFLKSKKEVKKNKNIKNNDGLNKTYYENGTGNLRTFFYKKKGKKDGIYKIFYKNGTEHEVRNYSNGLLNGLVLFFGHHENMRYPEKIEKYINGKNKITVKRIGCSVDYINYVGSDNYIHEVSYEKIPHKNTSNENILIVKFKSNVPFEWEKNKNLYEFCNNENSE